MRLVTMLFINLIIFSVSLQAQLKTDSIAVTDSIYKTINLGDVSVIGDRPIVKAKDGKLIYNMDQLIKGKVVSNAYESILKLPGVSEQQGNIVLAGTNKLTILINGQPTAMTAEQLNTLLKNIPESRVNKAEVMYSAPPQYHVRGAVINLIIKKNSTDLSPLQAQINLGYTQKYYASNNAGVNLQYTTKRMAIDFLYAVDENRGKTGMTLFSLHSLNDSIYSIQQENRGNNEKHIHNLRLTMDYDITDKDKVSIYYTGQITPTSNQNEKSIGNYSDSYTNKEMNVPIQMHNIAINYSSHFGLTLGGDYTYYGYNSLQNFVDHGANKNAFTANSNQYIHRYNAYADQISTLPKGWTLSYGIKHSSVIDRSSQSYHSKTGTDLSGLDVNSKIKEQTDDLYVGFKKDFSEKFSATISLAEEFYKLETLHQWALFPSAELTYQCSPSQMLMWSFSSDKQFPKYWELAKTIGYLNGYAQVWGNPALKPSSNYSSDLNYIIKNKYVLTLFASYVKNDFAQLPYQSSDALVLIYQTTNFDYDKTMGINITTPFRFSETFNSTLTLSGFYDDVKSSHFHDISFNNGRCVGYVQLDNSIQLSKKPMIKGEWSVAYLSPSNQGSGKLSQIWKLDAGLKWIFSKERAELNLKGSDLFNTWIPNMTIMNNSQNLKMNMIPDSRAINLSLIYKFGEYQEKDHTKIDTNRFSQ